MSSDITIQVHWADVDQKAASKLLQKGYEPSTFQSFGLILGGYFVAIIAATFVSKTAFLGAILGYTICVFSMNFYLRLRQKKMIAAYSNAPLRSEPTKYTFSEKGYAAKNSYLTATVTWAGIVGLVEGKNMTLLKQSAIEYVPIPDTSLPDGMTRSDLIAQLKSWMGEK